MNTLIKLQLKDFNKSVKTLYLVLFFVILFSTGNFLKATDYSLKFNGSQYVTTDWYTNIDNFGTGSFTIEAWVKIPSTGGGAIVSNRFDPSCGNFFTLVGGTHLSLEIDDYSDCIDNGLTGNAVINDNVWHYVAMVRN